MRIFLVAFKSSKRHHKTAVTSARTALLHELRPETARNAKQHSVKRGRGWLYQLDRGRLYQLI
jgi:hypothetical protein